MDMNTRLIKHKIRPLNYHTFGDLDALLAVAEIEPFVSCTSVLKAKGNAQKDYGCLENSTKLENPEV